MAGSAASLIIDLIVNANGAKSELDGVAGKFDEMFQGLKKAASGLVAGAAIAGFGKAALDAASDLEQAMGGVDAVFKQNADQVHEWASDTTDNIRLPQAEFEQLATIIGAQLKNAGVSMDQLGTKTKELIELGADLSAAIGGTTAEAVQALSSALKGEFDPMERYGVGLNQAAINTKALQLAQGDATKAAEKSVKVQATLALITEQTADFHGKAASEADTYAAAQEHLNEVWTNFLAATGGGALQGAGGILNMLANALEVVQPLAVAVGTLAGAFLQLPTPVLAAVAAFAAMLILRGPLTSMFASVVSGFQTMYLHALYAKDTFRNAGSGLAGMAAVAKSAGGAMKSAGSAILAGFGGGPMLAVTAVIVAATFAISYFTEKAARVKAMAEQNTQAVKSMADAIKGLDPDKIGEVGRQAAVATLSTAKWGKESQDLADYNDRLGISMSKLVDGMTNVPGAADEVEAAYQAQVKSLNDLVAANTEYVNGTMVENPAASQAREDLKILEEMHESYGGLIGVQQKAIDVNKEQADAIAGVTGETKVAITTTQDIATAYEKFGKAIENAAKNSQGSQWLKDMNDAAEKAGRAAEILGTQLDKLSGRATQNEEALVGFQRGLQDITAAFKAEGDAIDPAVLTTWNYEMLNATEKGRGLYDSLTQQTDAYNDVVAAAFASASAQGDFAAGTAAAGAAASKGRADFIGMHDAMGLTEAQAGELATKLGLMDGFQLDLSVVSNDAQAQASLASLQAMQIDTKTITVYADDKATPELDAKVSYIDAITGETRMIALGADPTSADAVLQAIIADANAASGTVTLDSNVKPATGEIAAVTNETYETTVQADANLAVANSQMTAFTSAARNITVQVQANTAPAESAINGILQRQMGINIKVDGMTSPFEQDINAILNRSYSVTVNVNANTSAATAAIASIPKTVSVGAAPAMAAPSMAVSTMAAPRMAVSPAASSSPNSPTVAEFNYNITLTGGITDPDGAARAIRKVLEKRDRRSSTVTAR